MRLLDGSGVSREAPAPFCEGPGVRFLRPTQHGLHWRLDVVFREDESRIRKGHAPANMTAIRHLCLNLLRQEASTLSIKKKRLKAAWNDSFRYKVLFG